ncbi:MAG: hypothetical protein LBJ46_04775, partial [Planctomycetota bacterium]|nr:hypothetical protein [Planctomycetota bacterium]
MAENNDTDDIDDFFAAADSADSAALRRAADNFSIPSADAADADSDLTEDDFLRYIAVDVDENGESGAPFKVVPVHIPSALPWWAWAAMSFILVG